MLDFSNALDLPLIWAGIIAVAVFMYVLLDGFDLGVGILYPFAPSHDCRSRMMNSVAPFWDGNETWLVLGGGGLFAAFPAAYAILMPALYLPVIFMLMGLIFRGVAFEFRFKSDKSRPLWDAAFHYGSLLATFMQGIILGNFVQGVSVAGRSFAGGPFDWANGFALLTGMAMVFGYGLLGATWLVMKTEGITQDWARRAACYTLTFVGIFMAIISATMPFVDPRVAALWFSLPNFFYLLPIPVLAAFAFVSLWRHLRKGHETRPFFLAIVLFVLGYAGLAISLWPWIVPFHMTVWQAAAAPTSQSLLLIGTALFLPLILAYTGYCYYTFRGKSGHHPMY